MVGEPFFTRVVVHTGSHLSTLCDDDGEFGFVVGSDWNILSGKKGPNQVNRFRNSLFDECDNPDTSSVVIFLLFKSAPKKTEPSHHSRRVLPTYKHLQHR